jgi:RNA polymerase sigma-70 factor, ECF subfamily
MTGAIATVSLRPRLSPKTPAATATLPDDDRRLAAACAAGDSAAFERLYRQHGERMKSIAYNHLGSRADAEDAVQETFLKVHRAAASFTAEASFATWLYRILINTCYDLLRRRKRRPEECFEDAIAIDRPAIAVDDAKRLMIRRMLAELPEQRRSVFTLFEIEGLSHAEIGQILGISEGNSKWILFSTKKQLQEQWKTSK